MGIRLVVAACSWAAIFALIRCGALAFAVRTPLTPFHQGDSRRNIVDEAHPRILQSISLNSWFESDDGIGVVTNWDSDQEEVELAQRMEKHTESEVDYKYWTVSSSTDEAVFSTDNETKDWRASKREKPHRRRRGFGMPGGSGATSDGVRFSVPTVYVETDTVLTGDTSQQSKHPIHKQQPSSRWYLTLDKATGLQVPLNMSVPTKEPTDKSAAARAKAEAAFRGKAARSDDDESDNSHTIKPTKRAHHEKKARQLASLLNVPIASARVMIRRAPSLGSMDILGTLSKRCVDMSLLLQCPPSKFASIIRHCPTLLTFRAETIATKLVQLDRLFSGQSMDRKNASAGAVLGDFGFTPYFDTTTALPLCGNQTAIDSTDVAESTLSIARRVPQLLASNIQGTLATRAMALYSLFVDENGKEEQDQAFTRVLKRCPELLLYNIEETIVPKLEELESLLAQRDSNFLIQQFRQSAHSGKLGTEMALREPRLLLYDVNESLAPKARLWRARVDDESSFTALLAKYPTLLMYSVGAAARLEYFAYKNTRLPDASEARQLLMLSKNTVETWGEEDAGCLFDSTPAILGGTISRRGRPREGESALDATRRRDTGRIAQSCTPHQLEELKIGELRKLLRENGGVPASKRKSELISELHTLGFARDSTTSIEYMQERNSTMPPRKSESQTLLSYRRWMAMKLCTSYPQFVEFHDDVTRKAFGLGGTKSAGDLEKLYGMALKRSLKASTNLADVSMSYG